MLGFWQLWLSIDITAEQETSLLISTRHGLSQMAGLNPCGHQQQSDSDHRTTLHKESLGVFCAMYKSHG